MAQMPEGRSRSGFGRMGRSPGDPGERQRQSAGTPKAPLSFAPPFSPSGRLESVRRAPHLSPTVTIGDRTYREIDNGRANVLVPVLNPLFTSKELAERKQGAERALFMANNPVAGALYGVASLANAPPRVRDVAMTIGGVADAAMSGAAARNAPVRRPPPIGKAIPITPRDGSIRYREANAEGQSQGMMAVLAARMLRTGTKAKQSMKPPGFISGKEPHNHDRAHLLAKQLGGHADGLKEAFASTRRPTNATVMLGFEKDAARRVRGGEILDYSVTPLYNPGVPAPAMVLMTMSGDRGPPSALIVENPLGRRK